MMFVDRDYERNPILKLIYGDTVVTVQNWEEMGLFSCEFQCKDFIKLIFDVVCNSTDMEYVVFHTTINTNSNRTYLEFYIRHIDGTSISSEPERQCVIQCLKAYVKRRAFEGVQLELCIEDKKGLLSEVMRTLRENGVNVTREDHEKAKREDQSKSLEV
ncbi:ACT domain-containing protein acr8 [Lathyrus oleraceus]|uniref:ACT domain-containing protein ACR n=1 Tax=Pisum sativum TaxID=3888 RepID=A0A9D4W4T2_PEA|nr:ACT domain-containing protein acr8 [Pisum sativum]